MRYADATVGQSIDQAEYKVERVNLVMYAGASGDFNPIHWSPSFAKAVGLPDTIATGMHTMGRIGTYLTDFAGAGGAVVRIRNRFTAPIVVGDEGASVTISGTITSKGPDNVVTVAFEAESAGANVSKGDADVRLA